MFFSPRRGAVQKFGDGVSTEDARIRGVTVTSSSFNQVIVTHTAGFELIQSVFYTNKPIQRFGFGTTDVILGNTGPGHGGPRAAFAR